MKHQEGFLKLVNDAKSRIREMTVDEYRKLSAGNQSVHLVDVREDSEWAAGHAAGAIHLGKGIIERDIETTIPRHDATIVLYCGGGYRSALAADALTKMGYEHVISLDGGWRAWNEAGLPVAKG